MLHPGTLTSTSLGRVRVSSAVCAITSPPGSPPGRHYTQVPRVLPPEHVRPRPNLPRDTPPRTPLSPPPCPCWRPAPPHLTPSPQHPYTEGPTTQEPPLPHRPSPPFPRVWPIPSRASPTASARPTIFLTASCRPSKSSERANPALKTASRSFANSGSSAYRSESPTLPLPSWAASSGSAAPLPCRNPATTLVGTGLNRRIWARERIVGSTSSREVASNTKSVSLSGSSSVLRSAFAACTFSVSALRINARRAPSKGRLAARRTISLTCPIVVNAPWGTISVRSG